MGYGPLNLTGLTIVVLIVVAALLVILIICACQFSNPFGLSGSVVKILATIATIFVAVIVATLTVTLWTERVWRGDLVTVRNIGGTIIVWAAVCSGAYRVHREFYSSW